MRTLILSLFPGIGMLDMAFEDAGFCCVRGPDLLWGGDIRNFHPPAGKFDGVIGGPPCQAFSRLRHMVKANGYAAAPNLIPEFERCVLEAQPHWFLMENVPDAPRPLVAGYHVRTDLLCDVWVGGETSRKRAFSFGSIHERDCCHYRPTTLALHRTDPEPTACAAGGYKPGITGNRKTRGKFLGWKTKAALVKMVADQGLPAGFLDGAPFTIQGKVKVVGNGVPLAMGRAVADAVRRAIGARVMAEADSA